MLRQLLAGLCISMGAQVLLPPILMEPIQIGSFQFGLSQGRRATVAVAAELSEIRDRGHLIVGIKTHRPPLSFINEDGFIQGFEIDIAHRLAAELLGDENAVRFVPLSNVDRLNAVMDDRVDIAIAAITLTEPRRRLVNFSDPYYLDGTAFIVRSSTDDVPLDEAPLDEAPLNEDLLPQIVSNDRHSDLADTIQTLQDLRLSPVAVLNRSSSVAHVRYILPGARLIGVDSYAEGQVLLLNGTVDAFAGDASVLTGWTSDVEAFASHTLLPDVVSAEPLAIALPKGTQYHELQAAINQSIRRWYAEEWLQERAEFWQLPSGVLSSDLAREDADMGLTPSTGASSNALDE